MKELLISILIMIGTLIVSVFVFTIGLSYSVLYCMYMTLTFKSWKSFFRLIWRMIDGFLAALGYIILETAIGIDMMWNVFGEIFEDYMSPVKEDTTFGEKGITVSSSIGKLEVEGNLNANGKGFSKILSFVFGQKQHAIDSWLMHQEKLELLKKYENVRGGEKNNNKIDQEV
jgi:hypothetical protein